MSGATNIPAERIRALAREPIAIVPYDERWPALYAEEEARLARALPPDLVTRIAVAGFKPDEIDITAQQNLLVVSGQKKVDGNDNRDFLHLGIANRNFERRFQLADHVFVKGADLADGLLIIQLERQVPEELKPRKILIGGTTPTVIEHSDEKKKGGKAA